MKLQFVRGHCGWDVVTLIPADQVPPHDALETALRILDPPIGGGLEVGFLTPGDAPNELRLTMADSTSRSWISMCGGMSQVIGKALVETFFRDYFRVAAKDGHLRIVLRTPSGSIPVEVEIAGGRAVRITTVMDEFVAHLYRDGVADLQDRDAPHVVAGEFIVLQVEDLERAHPGIDFTRRDPGPHLDIVQGILKRHMMRRRSTYGAVSMLFDARPRENGHFRLYPRFYSHDGAAARLPYEFQCGTGTVAVALVLAHRRLLPFEGIAGSITFEWGNSSVTPDPYGTRTSLLNLAMNDTRVASASFAHSVVEILEEGTLTLPSYGRPARRE